MTSARTATTRPWLKFSLRTLLAASVAISVPLGWLGNWLVAVREQQAIVTHLQRCGGLCGSTDFASGEPLGPESLRAVLGHYAFVTVNLIAFEHGTDANDRDLTVVARLPEVRWLDLNGPGFTDEGLRQLRPWDQFYGLHSLDTQVTARGVANSPIAPSVQDLQFAGDTVSDATLEEVHRLPQLRMLSIAIAPKFTDDGLRHLTGLNQLEELTLYATSVSDFGLDELRHHPYLRRLNLNSTCVSDAGMRDVAQCPRLTHLQLQCTGVGDFGVAELRNLDCLVELDLIGTQITDASTVHLAKLRNLRTLHLHRTAVSDQGLNNLRSLVNLSRLSIGKTNVSQNAASSFSRAMPQCAVIYP